MPVFKRRVITASGVSLWEPVIRFNKLIKKTHMITNQRVLLPKNRLRSIKQVCYRDPLDGPEALAAAYHLLEKQLPGNWIPRKMARHGQNLHCLLEIVAEGSVPDGATAWIVLQVTDPARWNGPGQYWAGPVQPPAAYRGSRRSCPVFLFLADVAREELYFLCTATYVQQHFASYLAQGSLRYCFDRQRDRFGPVTGPARLGACLVAHQEKQELENLLTLLLTVLDKLPAGADARYPVAGLLQPILRLLQGPLAYWAFTNRQVYYYVYSLSQRLLYRHHRSCGMPQ